MLPIRGPCARRRRINEKIPTTTTMWLGLAAVALAVGACRASGSHVYVAGRQPLPLAVELSAWEAQQLSACPCASSSLCLPVEAAGTAPRAPKPEVFAFSVAKDDRWRQYDWNVLTTVAWNTDKELLCHAHSKGVKVVIGHNFDDPTQLCDPAARREWILETYESIVKNHADGVNIDTEKAMMGEQAACQTLLVQELRAELQSHELTAKAQITFDVPWAPRPIDGRYYQWKELATIVDFFFVMSYDMRSQIYYQCIASANSPLALVHQGLNEYLYAYGIPPSKLVLGLPWYGYKYNCVPPSRASEICTIDRKPFFGAPCSDAGGSQIDYGDIQKLITHRSDVKQEWDDLTQSPYLVYGSTQLWYDDEKSLTLKYSLAKSLALRGVGMWNADTLDYAGDADGARRMWQALAKAIY